MRQGEGAPAPSTVNAAQSTQREREERALRVAQRMAELKGMSAPAAKCVCARALAAHPTDSIEDFLLLSWCIGKALLARGPGLCSVPQAYAVHASIVWRAWWWVLCTPRQAGAVTCPEPADALCITIIVMGCSPWPGPELAACPGLSLTLMQSKRDCHPGAAREQRLQAT